MGKVRGLRARVHQAAVRPAGQGSCGPAPPAREAAPAQAAAGGGGAKEWAFASTDIFAGTKIDPSALVQKLDPDARSVASIRREIEAIKLAERQRKAERKRRAAAVVGDLQPLRDALPELLELEAGARQPRARGVSRRPRPAELSRMSAAERLQLLDEERARFRELLASPAYRASPLLAIGQQLARQVHLDGGGQL
ncbi:protein FAM207A isoform X4 [Mustela putorius furo]|uniref:Protein FAM207A isoform X4 n=1 Tax=Mustela putorius furo TaxID=9669 RepID=A0A8U0SC75_MUSPF|nr:protein FAM207A isoform X4 [Mustela putorius furo]